MTKWPDGVGRVVIQEAGSTLDEAVNLADGLVAPFWLLAHRQTTARGRRGRVWSMPDGNFAATLVLRPNEPAAHSALRSFVMSLALYRAFVEVTGRDDSFSLKWPNDVLLNGGKVAGILLESAGRAGHVDLLTIGVGVNLKATPEASQLEETALRPVSVFAETSVNISAECFLTILAYHYDGLERQFQQHGFAAIRSGWLARAARLGEKITARTGTKTITGIFEDVDANGLLVLRGARGINTIAAADVYF